MRMMAGLNRECHAMRSIDVQDELAEGFEPSPLPAVGPDGGLQLVDTFKPSSEPPPRLCEAGPCRHYHVFAIHMDVQQPIPVRLPDGSIEKSPDAFHVEQHHYCYPDVGIELKLGQLPVLKCNRWDPREPDGAWGDAIRKKHQAEIAAWHARKAERDKVVAEPAAPLAEFTIYVSMDTGRPVPFLVTWETTLERLRSDIDLYMTPAQKLASWVFLGPAGDLISNESATMAHLDIQPDTILGIKELP